MTIPSRKPLLAQDPNPDSAAPPARRAARKASLDALNALVHDEIVEYVDGVLDAYRRRVLGPDPGPVMREELEKLALKITHSKRFKLYPWRPLAPPLILAHFHHIIMFTYRLDRTDVRPLAYFNTVGNHLMIAFCKAWYAVKERHPSATEDVLIEAWKFAIPKNLSRQFSHLL